MLAHSGISRKHKTGSQNRHTKTNKVKKVPYTALCDKDPPRMPLSSFCLVHLLLGMGPTLKSGKSGLFPERDSPRTNQVLIFK